MSQRGEDSQEAAGHRAKGKDPCDQTHESSFSLKLSSPSLCTPKREPEHLWGAGGWAAFLHPSWSFPNFS